jgi:prolyl oligopeptidase PreP (S9A serine peptidase family)
VFDLVVRERDGRTRKLVDIAALIARTGKPHAINYYAPSQDGAKVAVGVSVGGDENADLTVLDVASGRQIAGPISHARFAEPIVHGGRAAARVQPGAGAEAGPAEDGHLPEPRL